MARPSLGNLLSFQQVSGPKAACPVFLRKWVAGPKQLSHSSSAIAEGSWPAHSEPTDLFYEFIILVGGSISAQRQDQHVRASCPCGRKVGMLGLFAGHVQ